MSEGLMEQAGWGELQDDPGARKPPLRTEDQMTSEVEANYANLRMGQLREMHREALVSQFEERRHIAAAWNHYLLRDLLGGERRLLETWYKYSEYYPQEVLKLEVVGHSEAREDLVVISRAKLVDYAQQRGLDTEAEVDDFLRRTSAQP